jgi:hypothetical protein
VKREPIRTIFKQVFLALSEGLAERLIGKITRRVPEAEDN